MPIPAGLVAERRIIERLLRGNAVSAATAQPLELSRPLERRRLQRLAARGVVREASPNRYYVDAPAFAAYRSETRRRAALAALLPALAFALAIGLGLLAVR